MIDRVVKRSLGQLIRGVQVVGAAHDGVERLFTCHWFGQVSFEEPLVALSISPKHDTHGVLLASGRFSVSVLAADQVAEGQWFSYPGRRFGRVATEYVEDWDGLPVVPGSISWLRCDVLGRVAMADHDLVTGRVVAVREGRLKDPPLLYSSRLGWRATGATARQPGSGVRDRLLARVAEAEASTGGGGDDAAGDETGVA